MRPSPPWILPLVLLLALAACERPTPTVNDADGVRVDRQLGGTPDPGFARATTVRPFEFPRDHGAHPEFATEWWYLTGNLQDPDGRPFGYQLTLFRVGLEPGDPVGDSPWRATQLYMGHLAVSDVAAREHHAGERFSRAAAGLAGAQAEPFRVWLGAWSIGSSADDLFPLQLVAADGRFAIDLAVQRGDKALVLQGDRGLSQKGAATGNASYYYSFTRLPTAGSIRIDDQLFSVSGASWLDREWSSSALAADQAGWDWFALQLDDGRDLMFYRMRGRDGQAQRFSQGVLVAADGDVTRLSLADVQLAVERTWRGSDGTAYPVAWRMQIPAHDLDLQIEAAFDAQEMALTVRYWEGAVRVSGSQRGVGYLELSGYAR